MVDTVSEWLTIFCSLIISFVITWYGMQYLYHPPLKSEGSNIVRAYKNAGCVEKPGFIPSTAVMWDNGYKQKPFDVAWNEYLNGGTLVLFCP